jgi:hypothetical protein
MNIAETYLGIAFSISNYGNGTHAWAINPPMDAKHPEKSSATILGGQNEAILAARRAIGLYLGITSNLDTTQKVSGRPRN